MTEVPVLQLHKTAPAEDIAATLRLIADGIEKGKYGLPTTMVMVLGHTSQKVLEDGGVEDCVEHHTFSAGPRDDLFTVRGLLYTGLASIT